MFKNNQYWVVRFLMAAVFSIALATTGCGNDGSNGADGADGMDGADGTDGADGMDGADGTDGEDGRDFGEVVDVGNELALDALVAAGEPLVAEITDVTVASPPVVQFTVSTQNGTPVTGLPADTATFTFSKLVVEPVDSGLRSHWVSYINSIEVPRTDPPLTSPDLLDRALQASRDSGGELVDNGDGSYQYTFATDVADVTDPVAISWEPDFTHRAGIEIRIDDAINPDNPTFDFVPSGGAVTTKSIASNALCNNCHQRLALHGEGRFTVEYCVTCHNDQTRDQDYAENLDMAHMVHAIHGSAVRAAQESVDGEFSYKVLGFGERFGSDPFDFSHVTYPRPIIDCASCHTEDSADEDENSADGNDWQVSVDSLACGGCHVPGLTISDPDATTGLSTYSYTHNPEGGGSFAGEQQDGACATQCHAAGAAEFHVNLVAEESTKFAFRIDEVVLDGEDGAGGTGGSSGPWDGDGTIRFTVYNPIDDTPYDITAAGGPFDDSSARLRFRIAWSSDDYSNHETGEDVGQPIQIDALAACNTPTNCVGPNMDGSFTLSISEIPPSELAGDSIGVAMEGRARVDVDGSGSTNSIPITGQVAYANVEEVTDAASARREIVSIDNCNSCHGVLSFHGGNRTNSVQLCATCHNPNATDIGDRGTFCVGGSDDGSGCDLLEPLDCPGGTCTLFTGEATVDLKVMVHQIHAANTLITGRSLHDYTEVTYPRELSDCNACHLEGTWDPVDVTSDFRLATTTVSEDDDDPENDTNTTFNAATCGGCHLDFEEPDPLLQAHMSQNGASFDATQSNLGVLDPDTVETCAVCHGTHGESDL